ncbi:DUF4038 domain-containing protein [Alloacidobacterium sp.]|uniref:apiosidase-like domain-containing protein n=1 Tax=Alloacidobacterium sp. TaxID=2951999 RepID=UPI002D350432|nr:DUF4038 domain-containing protein [Alloacidobacterium sp.]HYK34312.1 DUF4038 domain-containing protein [Alloacidobacterium sp.]
MKTLAISAAADAGVGPVFGQDRVGTSCMPTEWSYTTGKQYSDPFNQVDVDAIITLQSGQEERVPGFWAGGSTWRVRYAPPGPGVYKIRSACNDTANHDLNDRVSTLHVDVYTGQNPHYKHGALRVAEDRRHFQHADGTPFFWLGDTWWMGLCKRLSWPDGFETLTADRVQKGFTIVQIVAGLYPDMEPFDARGANEAGFPWEPDFSCINPAYFDMADVRIQHLADSGLAACIVGFWGYFIPRMGMPKAKQHWRYLIARWGAYPVVWCLAGEGTMPYYLSKTKEQDAAIQKHGLTELARFVRSTDPHHHPITIHPPNSARLCVDDPAVLDFDMLQTGHSDRQSIPNTIETINRSLAANPKMPVLVGEVCYEGIMEASRQEVQRFMFWSAILSGDGGHTYGANGIWQINTRQQPYGMSPHGHSWGGPAWDIAAQLPGSGQLGLAKGLLTRYSWWKLEPKSDSIEPRWSNTDYWQPFAGAIPGEAIIVFSPMGFKAITFHQLQAATYKAFFFNPSDGTEVQVGNISPDNGGIWKAPEFPIFRDWVIVLEHKA